MNLKDNKDFLKMANSGAVLTGDIFLLKDININIKYYANITGATIFMKNASIKIEDGFGVFSNNILLNLDKLSATDVRNYTRGSGLFMSDIDYLNLLCGVIER